MIRNGFSLLELSIVLVIIGLIAGGIVAGSSMIRAAEMRAVITEQQQFTTAVYTFRDKYLGIPGDLKNATAFWGEAGTGSYSGACPGTNATPSTDGATCDGDSNGYTELSESLRFWQQLANAELISGSFTGVGGTGGTYHHVLGENAPASKLNGATWYAHERENAYQLHSLTGLGNTLNVGGQTTSSTAYQANMTPEEAWNIDKKLDDGLPISGRVIPQQLGSCASTTTYSLTITSPTCSVAFVKAY